MSRSPQSLAGLSLTEKRMLLAELLREKARRESTFPLSHGQRGLWFLYQLDPTGPAYNLFFPARIRARLDVPAFRRALQKLTDRHPSLRTTFAEEGGELRQHVHERLPVSLEAIDASAWDEQTLSEAVEEAAYRPFDLRRGPLLRLHLFTRGPEEHVFLLAAHHIVGDFWSLVLLVEEMQTLYSAECTDTAVTLPPPVGSYRDFVRWQRELLDGPEGERLWAYWRRRLEGVPSTLDLPTDRPRPTLFGRRGAAVACRLDAALTRRVKELAAAEGVTPYMVLLAAFQALLARNTGQDDFVVGSPFAGRSRPEFERVVGYFINLLPLRGDLSGDPPFRELLRRIGATVLEALQHQDYPFALLVERLELKRDSGRTPLIQATFTLEKAHRPVGVGCWSFFLPDSEVSLNVAGLPAEPYRVAHRTCQTDLEMVLEEGGGALHGMIRYNSDLFDEATVRRLAERYRLLLAGAADDPARRVSELPLLSPAEEWQVLYEWNDTRADYPRDLCLHQMFERQAERTPRAVALRWDGGTLTYAELDRRANRLAHRLRRSGVGPGTVAALCLERSPEMVVAILGVLKAGGAYVPLDPAGPAERAAAILADTRTPVVVTCRHLLDRLPSADAEVVCLEDAENADLDDERTSRPPDSGVKPEDLAYILYTSGSSGRSKGVMIEHRAVCNTICWHCRELPVGGGDRVLLLIPYVFDASVAIIFPALACGAELVLAAPGEERDPTRILERLRNEAITALPILPRVLRLMLDERLREAGKSLRWVLCGGEAMPADLPGRLFDLLDVKLYNCYGPTEVAIDATCWPCQPGDTRPTVPIGRPIGNVRTYVLDQLRQPVPVGIPGELYVGGAGLARGYLNEPERTAERFVADPFVAGARMYRTGDRCRWLPDGSLEFLGRLDRQVKVRGNRVEIGEVESVLAAHPSVEETAVVARAGADGDERLVAYVSARPGAGLPTPELLRRHLRQRLPEYMIPSAFVLLPSLPQTASGKVDVRALPPPAVRPSGRPFVAPRTALEELLTDLWRDILGVKEIGVSDNFFELGGNSVQAAVFINRLQEKLGRQVYTVAVFDAPTIEGLARYLEDSGRAGGVSPPSREQQGADAPRSPLVLLSPGRRQQAGLFLVHPPGGIVVCYQALARHLGDERPVYGLRARGLHGETGLPASLEAMAADYVAALRAAQPEGPYHLGGWSMGGVVAYEMARQLRVQGQCVGLLTLLDTTIPANAANEPFAEGEEVAAREYGLDKTLAEIDRLGPDEQLPYLWDHVRKLGLVGDDTPQPLVRQILDDMKRLFHAHVTLANDYAVGPYPGKLTLFRPSDSPVADSAARDRQWGRRAKEVEVHFVPGLHHTMVKDPHAQSLAEHLRDCLRRADREIGLPS